MLLLYNSNQCILVADMGVRGVVLQEARAEEQILHLNIGVQNTWDQVTFLH